MKIVILGCGRLGKRVSQKMVKDENNSVIVIDKDVDSLNALGKEFTGKVLQGDGVNMETYVEVMKEKPDVFFALTSGDNANIMAAEIAKQKYKVEKVIARVYDSIRAKAFEELGIEIFCPTTLSEKRITEMLGIGKNGEKKVNENGK